jgi:hypothetical protein
MEAKYFVLPPLSERFHYIDKIQTPPTLMQQIDLLWQSIVISLLLWPRSFCQAIEWLLRPVIDFIKNTIDILFIKENPEFNYGAVSSIRENESSAFYRHYFQILDKDMFVKTLENALFEELVEFLDSKNIDTSELKSRQTQILNEGIIMSGGEINSKALSVGRRSRALFKQKRTTIEQSRRNSSGLRRR